MRHTPFSILVKDINAKQILKKLEFSELCAQILDQELELMETPRNPNPTQPSQVSNILSKWSHLDEKKILFIAELDYVLNRLR